MKEERDEKNNKTELKRELKKASEQMEEMEGERTGMALKRRREGGDTQTGKGGNEGDL